MGKPAKSAIEMIAQGIEAKKDAAVVKPKPVLPTPERMKKQSNHRISGTKGVKFVPVINTMLSRDQITLHEYTMLSYYRDQACLADKSPVKSCIDFSVKGGDMGPPAAITSALLETARIERDLGSLRRIARAVAVDDVSISQWCIDQFGGRERYNGKGKLVAIVPIGEAKRVRIAIQELRRAARKIVK